jgi:hypothetical protein
MRTAVVALFGLVLALAGAAGAASPGANVALVYAQELGPFDRFDTSPHRYLCAAPPNGSTGRKVTPRDGHAVDPDVSPSGSDVAYVTTAAAPLGVLERVPVGGGAVVRPAGDRVAAWPAWSSNGQSILFSSTGTTAIGGDLDIFSVPREGGSLVRMVGGPAREAMPAISADGQSLLFVRSDPTRPAESGGELWRTAALHPNFPTLRLTDRTDITHPDWSPDGTRIVFGTADGIRVLTFTPSVGPVVSDPITRGTHPEFSPDGTRIAFVRDGDVWAMSAPYGGEEVNVTHSPIAESGPTWQAAAIPTGGEEPCAIVGTPGDDVLTGSDFDDFFYDGGGDDVVRALGGNDRAFDDEGNDRFELGDGDDQVVLRAGRNHVLGGAGADQATVAAPTQLTLAQTLEGGDGDDGLDGGGGGDRLVGGDGNDRISGQRGPDTIFAGPGNDRAEGNRGDDSVDGGLGNDVLYGGLISGAPANYDGYDVLLGRGGNDRIAGGWQKDRLFGGTGADRLRGGPHADHIRGEEGADDIGGEGGDDLLLSRDRVRDRVFGGPGFDRATLDAVDRRGGIERRLR